MKKIAIIFSLILILSVTILPTISNAVVSLGNVNLYSKEEYNNILKYGDINIVCNYVVYEKDGVEYPAYCLNRELPGVTPSTSYQVTANELVTNVKVWRAIINGYPYKTYEELGCNNVEEAFLATKQAVYCMLYDREPSEYTAIGEAGERTLDALTRIVEAARNSSAVKVSSELVIKSDNSLWQIDSINNQYISQTFSVQAGGTINSYEAIIEGEVPEGTILTDVNNNVVSSFKSGEKFKILIPLLNIAEDGNFIIKVTGKVKTKPILYGESGNSGTQNYALTAFQYEDGEGEESIYYTKNSSKIVITKKADKTGIPLKGVQFQLLDENQQVIYSELTTGENGEVEISNLLPGKYYIKETRTLPGYSIYDKLIEVDLKLNETVNITVNNAEKEVNIEEKDIETNIVVENIESTKEITLETVKIKLPRTGM